MTNNTKLIIGIIVVAVVLLAPVGFLITRSGGESEAEPIVQERRIITKPVNLIEVPLRPYLTLTPRNDGREVVLSIAQVNKPAQDSEFELEYTAGSMIQGAFGAIDLSGGSGEYKILLGSCSAGGTCSYHQDVTGGKATVHLFGPEDYSVQVNWRFQVAAKAQGKYGTQDQKFQVETSDSLNNSAYVIVAETSGPPSQVAGDILAGPYGIFASNGFGSRDQLSVTVRLNDEVGAAKILGWDGSDWVEMETAVDGRVVSTSGPAYVTYVVVGG